MDYAITKVKGEKPRYLIFFKVGTTMPSAALEEYTVQRMRGKEAVAAQQTATTIAGWTGACSTAKRRLAGEDREADLRKKLVQNLPYLLIGLYATKLSQAW